jgi:hypothetical protein
MSPPKSGRGGGGDVVVVEDDPPFAAKPRLVATLRAAAARDERGSVAPELFSYASAPLCDDDLRAAPEIGRLLDLLARHRWDRGMHADALQELVDDAYEKVCSVL